MKSMLSMAILSIFLSACISAKTEKPSKEVPKSYGILPFETENITPKTARLIPKKYNENLATTVKSSINNLRIDLDKKRLDVYLIKDEQPISRTDVEIPVASFDDEYKNTLYTDLQDMSADYDGIIFGHLEEEFAGNGSLLLIMRVYKKGGDIESFEGEPIDLGVVNTKGKMTKQLRKLITKLLVKVKRYIVEPPVVEDDEEKGQYGDLFDSSVVVEQKKPKAPKTGLPERQIDSSKATTSMSLKEVYKMLYEQRFYVMPALLYEHRQARIAAANELRVSPHNFYNSLKQDNQRDISSVQLSCSVFKVVSNPSIQNRKGKIYDLCYDIRFLYKEYIPREDIHKVYCHNEGFSLPLLGRGLVPLKYQQAKREIDRLRQETGKEWRIPTIDELYALTDYLEYSSDIYHPNVIWSSTSHPNQPDKKWVIRAYFEGYWKTPRPKLGDSYNDNLRSNYPDAATLFPVYNCGPNN